MIYYLFKIIAPIILGLIVAGIIYVAVKLVGVEIAVIILAYMFGHSLYKILIDMVDIEDKQK